MNGMKRITGYSKKKAPKQKKNENDEMENEEEKKKKVTVNEDRELKKKNVKKRVAGVAGTFLLGDFKCLRRLFAAITCRDDHGR